jgi:protein ImuB
VLRVPVAAEVVDAAAHPVRVSGRALLSAEPSRISVGGGPWREIRAWAGPWPAADRWWATRRRRARLQVVTGSGTAVLLSVERGQWWLDAVYD